MEMRRRRQRIWQLLVVLAVVAAALLALQHLNLSSTLSIIRTINAGYIVLAVMLMTLAMSLRAVSWRIVLREALLQPVSFRSTFNALVAGIFISATSPFRLGEAARAIMLARHTKDSTRNLPVIAGTILSQTLMNILALALLGSSLFVTALVHIRLNQDQNAIIAIILLTALVIIALMVARRQQRFATLQNLTRQLLSGFRVFRSPLPALTATTIQLLAWFAQMLSCLVLFPALKITPTPEIAAAAAILFAVNITAAIPLTPSNVGPFQAACIAVLSGVFGVAVAPALAYGILLQAVEVVTAVALGTMALSQEGMSRQKLLRESQNPSTAKGP